MVDSYTFQNLLYSTILCNYVMCVFLTLSRSCFWGSAGVAADDGDFRDDGVEVGTDGSTGGVSMAWLALSSATTCTSGIEDVDGRGACSSLLNVW